MRASVRLSDPSYRLSRALLVYESDGDDPPFVTAHRVVRSAPSRADSPAYLGPGRRIDPRDAHTLLKKVSAAGQGCAYLPERVLSFDLDRLLWYRPAGLTPIHFDSPNAALNALSGVPLPHPRLVFRVQNGKLSVWAVRWPGRPRPDTLLYHAPYFNVSSGGRVCHGSMAAPGGATPDDIQAWEDAFFKSTFTHGGGARFLSGTAGYAATLETLARRVQAGESVRFPTDRLIRTGDRLQHLLQ